MNLRRVFIHLVVSASSAVSAMSCSSTETCNGGLCSCTSYGDDPAFMCNGVCVHIAIDPNNCGACGNVCDAAQFCSNGQCSTTCPPLAANDIPMCEQTDDGPITCPPTYAACSAAFALCQCETGIPRACGCR